tara:strand:+ start:7951 stop:8769 length:819 start_codon:yes stop_codon:yes gene_type:complete
MLVSIQGIKGSYHHNVASLLYGDKVNILECLSFDKLAESIFESKAERGIMAIENSIAGSIIPNYTIIDKLNLKIVGEYYININHNLLVHEGVKISDVEKIYSHPMAFLQCKDYLKKIDKILIEDVDTAHVAKLISEQKLKNVAAIASVNAAKIYGLKILKKNIQSEKYNQTRFVIISKKVDPKIKDFANKASIKFILSHRNGSLANVLNIIAKYDINLTKIQSIPIVESPWKYSFFVDLTFPSLKNYKNCFKDLMSVCEDIKEFGVYNNFKK